MKNNKEEEDKKCVITTNEIFDELLEMSNAGKV